MVLGALRKTIGGWNERRDFSTMKSTKSMKGERRRESPFRIFMLFMSFMVKTMQVNTGEPLGGSAGSLRYIEAAKRSAEAMVLAMSMAMVMGPTPPGTGAMARHFGATSWKATSPTIL